MRNAFLASASAVAIVLGGCSMFQSHDQSSQSRPSSSPAYSSSSQSPAASASSQAPASAASSQTSSAAATDEMGSTSSKSMSHHSMARQSMNADRVKQAQQKLKDSGDYKGQVDGKLGPQTAMAVKQYQQKNGLKQTGRLDRDTLAKLGAGTAGSGSSAPSTGSSASDSNSMPSAGSAKPDAAIPPANSGSANPPADKVPAH
jgi:peptidoglycan hydrolase-like protein with peptidoglycan-binding domain